MFSLFLFSCISGASSRAPPWISDPFNPSSLPMAVKSPYLNYWLPQGQTLTKVNYMSPLVWDGRGFAVWNAAIRVDGKAYNLLGSVNSTGANQTRVLFTPTRTSFLLVAGAVDINMTILSPIEAHDLTRLSMPFIYLYLSAIPNDNNPHEIQFYSDISREWVEGVSGLLNTWAPEDISDFVSLRMQPAFEEKYQEEDNLAQDSVFYHSMQKQPGVSWEIGKAGLMHNAFINGTGLQNRTDSFVIANSTLGESLGISVNIGSIQPGTESNPVVYTIGLVRDPVIQYVNGNNQLEERRAYYWANFTSINDVIKDALDHFDDALAASIELDNKLLTAANSISTEYAGLISLVTRSAMSAIEYTISINENDNDPSSVKAFMKNMGNVGSGQVNAVDVIYAAMPVYLYLNPNIIGYLLSPLLDSQSSPQYTFNYAAIDLGGPFPNATGNLQGHNEGIEQSANMIILSYAHAQASRNENLINQYYDLLSKWGDYLVNNTLSPTDQTTSSSDNIGSTNQTNLILKGIIGIRAMSEISSLTGHSEDFTKYKAKADQYYQSWENLAILSDRIALTFGGSDSGLIYNLYADKLLGLNVVNDSVYALQTSFYRTHLSQQEYGVPLNASDSSLSRTDWMLFAASATTDTQVRDNMIHQVYNYATSNHTNYFPISITYDPSAGQGSGSGSNSPAHGAIFAPLSLTIVTLTPDPRDNNNGDSEKHPSTGLIVVGIVGGVAVATFTVACILLYRRRKQKKTANRSEVENMGQVLRNRDHSDIIPVPFHLPRPLINITAQASKLINKTTNSVPTSLNISTPGPNVRSSTSAGQGDNVDGEALREEVNNLRLEIERLREENAPPSYVS